MQTQSLVAIALVPLIIWRVYGRIRRLVSRQKSIAWRHWATAILFPALVVLLALGAFARPLTLVALAGGVLAGLALAIVGLRQTRFERSAEGFFYTPSASIGIGLSALLVSRIAYRLFEVYEVGMNHAEAALEFGSSPLTLLVFGMLAGYYAGYAVGLLRWRAQTPLEGA